MKKTTVNTMATKIFRSTLTFNKKIEIINTIHGMRVADAFSAGIKVDVYIDRLIKKDINGIPKAIDTLTYQYILPNGKKGMEMFSSSDRAMSDGLEHWEQITGTGHWE